ncbi:CvpA family protein [Lichenibacterium minor]|uniref:CvpA family protein n=1 Tax=Lichenibacterium minor TaxID=2316528 RepID=A0A4Q2U901_9HYPH|nr:CvpA family protein [Lichenibacterium minor]RYC32922.1 CvpA family protein [Lichenibacterium minor]
MPSYLDLALLGIVVISALLSMVRGFAREVLAIASWGAAAVAAYLLYPRVMPYLEHYIAKDTVRMIAAIAIVFFTTLVLVSIVTVKLSDAILDSRIGALDRTLGFAFGAARGFLLGVVAFLFFNWLVPAKSQPDWVLNAKAKPLLVASGNQIVSLLPDDADALMKRFKRDKGATGDEAPADTDAPAGNTDKAPAPVPPSATRRTEATPPAVTPSAATPKTTAAAAPMTTDKQGLDAILNGSAQTKAAKKKP